MAVVEVSLHRAARLIRVAARQPLDDGQVLGGTALVEGRVVDAERQHTIHLGEALAHQFHQIGIAARLGNAQVELLIARQRCQVGGTGGMSRPLLKFGGGSVEILRDVLH